MDTAGADYVHVDVMDGRFVPNITIGPVVVAAVRAATRLPLDVHLMIVEPERYVEAFARAGADLISVHLEASPHLHRTVQLIRSLGKKASVSVNPHTSIDGLHTVLPDLSMVLLMTVNPGFGGQRFIDSVVPKIRDTACRDRTAPAGRRHRSGWGDLSRDGAHRRGCRCQRLGGGVRGIRSTRLSAGDRGSAGSLRPKVTPGPTMRRGYMMHPERAARACRTPKWCARR